MLTPAWHRPLVSSSSLSPRMQCRVTVEAARPLEPVCLLKAPLCRSRAGLCLSFHIHKVGTRMAPASWHVRMACVSTRMVPGTQSTPS